MHQHFAAVRLLNEVIQHGFGHFEIGDYSVLHGPDGDDVAGRAAQHFLRLLPDGFYLTGILVDSNNGRFVDYNAFASREDQRVGGAEIDGQIARKHAEQRA